MSDPQQLRRPDKDSSCTCVATFGQFKSKLAKYVVFLGNKHMIMNLEGTKGASVKARFSKYVVILKI